MRFAGVVVGAGRGDRFGGDVPKQFVEIGGVPLVALAVQALASRPRIEGVVVVVPPEESSGPRATGLRGTSGVLAVVAGGENRAASVRCGLAAVSGFPFVLVHDAARPFPSPSLVDAVVDATLAFGAAVPVLPVPDTVKEDGGSGFVARTVDRSRLRLAQTPQGSRLDWLVEALRAADREGVEVTDEAAALERAGHPVRMVAGDPTNAKITTPQDLEEARLRRAGPGTFRVGTGFDVHRFAPGRALVLGGVPFPDEVGLEGHSDADVALHAAMDAVLGAAALGDIGTHFPDDDPALAVAASTDLARRVAARVAQAGFAIANVDLTLLAERPRIQGRVPEMREAIAGCFGVSAWQVSVKATTLEGLGSLGRSEGIACQAVALLRRCAELP